MVSEQVGGGVEALSPEARGERSLDQKGVHDVVRIWSAGSTSLYGGWVGGEEEKKLG